MTSVCIFCAIRYKKQEAGEIAADAELFVVPDKFPKAQLHLLIMPTRHIATLRDTNSDDQALLGALLAEARDQASKHPESQSGYKLVMNVGAGGGQKIPHIHLHLLAGNDLSSVT